MRSLILNLTRFGDLIQSQPVITGLAAQGPCSLVCLENFARAAGLLADLDAVHALPGAGLLADLDRKGDTRGGPRGPGWQTAVARLSGFVAQVMDAGKPDLVVNLTPSLSARLLASQLAKRAGAELRGFAVDPFGFNADTSSWAVFLQMASANRGASPFNVVDLFRRAAGLGGNLDSGGPDRAASDSEGPYWAGPDSADPGQSGAFRLAAPDQAALARIDVLLAQDEGLGSGQGSGQVLDQDSGRAYAGFQLGASEERRRWPVERFAEVALGLHQSHGLIPVLLGSRGEASLGQDMAGHLDRGGCPHVNLMGRTSLAELGSAVSRLSLLVTNDTGTMHLAAGLQVPIAAIFLATAQPFDTGPYLEGAICFEPDLDCHPCAFGSECAREHACRMAVPARAVLDQARRLLRRSDTSRPNASRPDPSGMDPSLPNPHQDAPGRPDARVWQAFRAPDGFMDYASLSGHETEARTRWIRLQRHFYRRFLDELPPEPPAETQGKDHGLPPDLAESLTRSLDGVAGALQLLQEQAKLLAMAPRDVLKRKFLANWQRVGALLTADSHLEVLGFLWGHQTQSQGGDLASMARTTARYHALVLALSQALARPVS